MQRVVVLGRGGAGKSTFARKLGNATGLPLIELDQHFWQPGLIPLRRERWGEIQRELAKEECWIMDGDLGKYDELGVRLQAADTVLVLDFSLFRCLVRALHRSKERMDFWWWLVTWRCIERPKIKKAIAEHAASADVRPFGKQKELEQYLASCGAARPQAVQRLATPNDMHRARGSPQAIFPHADDVVFCLGGVVEWRCARCAKANLRRLSFDPPLRRKLT